MFRTDKFDGRRFLFFITRQDAQQLGKIKICLYNAFVGTGTFPRINLQAARHFQRFRINENAVVAFPICPAERIQRNLLPGKQRHIAQYLFGGKRRDFPQLPGDNNKKARCFLSHSANMRPSITTKRPT